MMLTAVLVTRRRSGSMGARSSADPHSHPAQFMIDCTKGGTGTPEPTLAPPAGRAPQTLTGSRRRRPLSRRTALSRSPKALSALKLTGEADPCALLSTTGSEETHHGYLSHDAEQIQLYLGESRTCPRTRLRQASR
jgi:hypothetical protein